MNIETWWAIPRVSFEKVTLQLIARGLRHGGIVEVYNSRGIDSAIRPERDVYDGIPAEFSVLELCNCSPSKWFVISSRNFHLQYFDGDPDAALLDLTRDTAEVAVEFLLLESWSYRIAQSGKIVTRYNSESQGSSMEEGVKTDDGRTLAKIFTIGFDRIARYFLPNPAARIAEGMPAKAYPDDHYPVSEPLVIRDLMRKLGLSLTPDHRDDCSVMTLRRVKVLG
jgi:hypothetical protein